jgi:hypothetical protein
VMVIALLAVLAGGPTAIACWAMLKQMFLSQVLDLPTGSRQGCLPTCPDGTEAVAAPWATRAPYDQTPSHGPDSGRSSSARPSAG